MQYTNPDGIIIDRPEHLVALRGPVRESRDEAEKDLPLVQEAVEEEKARVGCIIRHETVAVHEDFDSGEIFAFGKLRFWPPEMTQADLGRLPKTPDGRVFFPARVA